MNCKTCNIAAPQYELFDGLCGKCLLRELTKLREQVRPIARALDTLLDAFIKLHNEDFRPGSESIWKYEAADKAIDSVAIARSLGLLEEPLTQDEKARVR